MLREAMLIGIFALVLGGAWASDKPAVQARERMEAEAAERSTETVRERTTVIRESKKEEHPASDVGYRRHTLVHESRATKPAVQAREHAEE